MEARGGVGKEELREAGGLSCTYRADVRAKRR